MWLGFIASGPGQPSSSGPAPCRFGIFPLLSWPLPSPWAVPDVNHRSAPLLTPPNPTFYPLLHHLPQPKAHPSQRDGIFWVSPFPKRVTFVFPWKSAAAFLLGEEPCQRGLSASAPFAQHQCDRFSSIFSSSEKQEKSV